MSKELTKELIIVAVRNGVEVSIEKERIPALLKGIERGGFCEINGEFINPKDIVGIFAPQTMEAVIRKKQGQWQDKEGNWHNKGDYVCSICGRVVPYGMKCGYCSI